MRDKKSPGTGTTARSNRGGSCEPHHSTEMIPQARRPVKANWLRDYRARCDLSAGEIVELIRSLCPGFDRTLLTKCSDPERYGVQLSRRVINQLKRMEGGKPDE